MSDVGERELLAIIFTDAVDSTARTASDEDYSLRILLADLDYMRNEAAVRGGTVLKNTGDGLLISFKSAVDAVECAISIQSGFVDRSENSSFLHKIGVHIGDVIKKDGDIYGNGVNTASRLVAQCPPGGICLSSTLYELVKQKSQIGELCLENFQLKNIEPPIKAYRLGNFSKIKTSTNQEATPKKNQKPKSFNKNKIIKTLIFGLITLCFGFIYFYKKNNDHFLSSGKIDKILGIKDGDIVGVWRYFNGATVVLTEEGMIMASWENGGKVFGNYKKIEDDIYRFEFENDQGGTWYDILKRDERGNYLEGKNHMGVKVSATKISNIIDEKTKKLFEFNLNGTWFNNGPNDASRTYIRQNGDEVAWYSESSSEKPLYAHVLFGQIKGNRIFAKYYDIPKGEWKNLGEIKMKIVNSNEINFYEATGGWRVPGSIVKITKEIK